MTETQCVIGSPEWMRSVDRRLTELNRKVTEIVLPKITINPTVDPNGKIMLAKIEEHPDFQATIAKAFAWFDDSNGDQFEAMSHYKNRAGKFVTDFRSGLVTKIFAMVE